MQTLLSFVEFPYSIKNENTATENTSVFTPSSVHSNSSEFMLPIIVSERLLFTHLH